MIAAASLLPIWRAAPDRTSMNVWEYWKYTGTEEYQDTHIEYEVALMKARKAWAESEQ